MPTWAVDTLPTQRVPQKILKKVSPYTILNAEGLLGFLMASLFVRVFLIGVFLSFLPDVSSSSDESRQGFQQAGLFCLLDISSLVESLEFLHEKLVMRSERTLLTELRLLASFHRLDFTLNSQFLEIYFKWPYFSQSEVH